MQVVMLLDQPSFAPETTCSIWRREDIRPPGRSFLRGGWKWTEHVINGKLYYRPDPIGDHDEHEEASLETQEQ